MVFVTDMDSAAASALQISKEDYINFSNFIGVENAYMIAMFYFYHEECCNDFIHSLIKQIRSFYNEGSSFKTPLSDKQRITLIDAIRDHLYYVRQRNQRCAFHQSMSQDIATSRDIDEKIYKPVPRVDLWSDKNEIETVQIGKRVTCEDIGKRVSREDINAIKMPKSRALFVFDEYGPN